MAAIAVGDGGRKGVPKVDGGDEREDTCRAQVSFVNELANKQINRCGGAALQLLFQKQANRGGRLSAYHIGGHTGEEAMAKIKNGKTAVGGARIFGLPECPVG